MAKNKKKKGFHILPGKDSQDKTSRLPDDAIDLTSPDSQESDSDLDINELLKKYMPEYQNESDGKDGDELRLPDSEPEQADDSTDLSSLLRGLGDENSPGLLDASDTGEEDETVDLLSGKSGGGEEEQDRTGTDSDPLASLLAEHTEENRTPAAVWADEKPEQPEQLAQPAQPEPKSGDAPSLADRWAAAMTSDDETDAGTEPESEAPAEDTGTSGLFSRILRSSESEAMAEDEPGSEPAGDSVFSKIRRTVEEEENRQAEQGLSDEALMSALDSAFAYPAEEGSQGSDFQVPVAEKPDPSAGRRSEDLIQEYEFDRGDSTESPDGGAFTVSDTTDRIGEDDRIDFKDDLGEAEEAVYGKTNKPVGEEMTDEQVLGLFGEVKPQKKKFSLFRRNKKPKPIPVSDDEFLPDDGLIQDGIPAENAPTAEPVPTEPPVYAEGPADAAAEPVSEPYPSEAPAFDDAEDDTDALIAEATAAMFGKRRAAAEGPAPEASAPQDGSAFSDSIEDAVDALWREVGGSLEGTPDLGEPAPDAVEETPADGFESGKYEEIAAEASAALAESDVNAETPPTETPEAELPPEEAAPAEPEIPAEAIPSAPQEPAPAAEAKPETPAPRKKGELPFVRQSKRSAANLTDEELLAWAAETLAEDRREHDFDASAYGNEEPAPAETPAEDATKPVGTPDAGEAIPDVAAFDGGASGEIPAVTADSSLEDLETYLAASEKAAGDNAGSGTWQKPDKPYEDEEFDPTDINLMVAFDLDDGDSKKTGKASAFGDKLAAKHQNRETVVRLDRPEFVDRTQIPAIRKEYRNRSLSLFIRLILCVVFGVLLFLFENIEPVTKLVTGTGMQFGGVLDPRVYPTVYAMVSLQLMLFCCLCAFDEIYDGVRAIFTGCPKPESMTALLAVAGILYSAVIGRVTVSPEEPVMFNYVVGLACFMTLISAVYRNKREMMNFRIISSKKTKHIVRRLKDDESELETKAFAEAEDACDVMKIEKTDFIDGFFARLQKPDQTTGTFMMFVMGAAVLLSLVIGIIDRVRGGSGSDVARSIYGSLLMLAPLSVFISFSYPFYRANVTAKDYDSAIIGETSLEEYSNASIISFDDKNVFPSYSVKVQNVRIYNNARIDRVLYYASSVFACAGGPLQDVFEDVTKDLGTSNNVKIFETEDDFLATQVDGVNIIFGGCEKLRSRGFVIDDEAAEDDVDFSDELSIMYMFRENKLVAKMYIKYEMDSDIDTILKQFSGNGLYACVRTFDPNISEAMVAKKLSTKKMPLKIVRYANLDEVVPYEAKVDSGLVTCGQQKSLLQVIAYCGKVLRTKKTHIALSVLAVLITTAIVVILELADLLGGMNSLLVTLYQLVWLIPTMITSRVFIR